MNILHCSWGGRGEHGILEIDMELTDNIVTLELSDKCYSDWGRSSQLTDEKKYSKSYNIGEKELTRQELYCYVMDLVENECGITWYKIKVEDIIYNTAT